MPARIGKTLAALAVVLTFAGCATPAPPPAYTDAFQGLLNQSSTTVPPDKPVAVRQPLGLIFSNNVEVYLKYVQAGAEGMKAYGALTNTTAVADLDPKFVAGRVVALLKAHYGSVELVPDFNQAVAKGQKSVCLVDIQVVPGQLSGETTNVDIVAYFFDDRMRPVSRISGHGSGVVPYPAWDVRLQQSTDAAVGELDGKLTALAK
jgi:hypothetical protein